jgi:hypothetical protein
MIYRGPDFFASYALAPPQPLLPSVSSTGDTQERLRKRDNLQIRGGVWGGRGVARKTGPL